MSNRRITLVNSNRLKPGAPPVALDYLAAECDSRGIGVEILDLCHSKNTQIDIDSCFREQQPDLVGVSIRNLDDVHSGHFFLEKIKVIIDRLKHATTAPIVVGGSGFSIAPERALDYLGLDLGIAGEGEEALPMLVENLGNLAEYPRIPGLVYRTGDGFACNPLGASDVGKLSISRRGYVDYTPYLSESNECNKTCAVQTKRGCPQSCTYCIVPTIEGRTVRLRPPDQVVDEIENLAGYGFTSFWFADSEFNCPEEHAKAICREMIDRGLPKLISWYAYTAPKPFSQELAELMRDAGCALAINCIDHGCDAMLEGLGKDFRTEDIAKAVVAARDAKLNTTYCLMVGGPGDTLDTLLSTLNFLLGLRPIRVAWKDPWGLRVYPNSPLADIVSEQGFSRKNRSLFGKIKNNDDYLEPVYYFSKAFGPLTPPVAIWRRLTKAKLDWQSRCY